MGVLLEYTLKRHSQAWKEGVGKPKGKSMEGHGDGNPREKGGKPIGMRQRERCVESCHRRAWKARRPFQGEAKGKVRKGGRGRPRLWTMVSFFMPWKGRREHGSVESSLDDDRGA